MQSARIISISGDEVTAVDNTSWIGIHVYAMERWKKVSHLLHLSHVSNASIASHLTIVIMDTLINERSLTTNEIASKVVCFGANGVSHT